MSAIEKSDPQLANQASITAISANARIDYILRFSKQAILIVDQDEELSSQVSRQYLGNLSENHNAAYVAISAKHNDIQVRCRIVEQLFANTLFDPEQSLAVSIVNLVKEHNKYTSIVIENMQNASLQILHELTQVALIAKKSNLNINVVMAGANSAALLASDNASLFGSSLSILSAQSGQLLPLNPKLFRDINAKHFSGKTKKLAWGLSASALLICAIFYGLNSSQLFQFSQIPQLISSSLDAVKSTNNPTVLPIANEIAQTKSTADKSQTTQLLGPLNQVIAIPAKTELASAADVLLSLQMPSPQTIEETPIASQPSDILAALGELSATPPPKNIQNKSSDAVNSIKAVQQQADTELSAKVLTTAVSKPKSFISFIGLSNSYYQDNQGFVVQFSGFTQQKALDEYLVAHREISFSGYNRLLSDKEMVVLTSAIFDNAEQAKAFLASLSPKIKQSGAFIKSTQAINNEISAFQLSQ